MRKRYPILEFDRARAAVIEPGKIIEPVDAPAPCVICFFGEVVERILHDHQGKIIGERKWEDGPRRLYEIDFHGQRLAVIHPGVGAPSAVGALEQAIAFGCRRFIACGGAGVLNREIAVGHAIVPTSAVRDEGTSYHYLAPSREVRAAKRAVAAIKRVLQAHQVAYVTGKTWTTDAPYRETPAKVKLRRAEGCLTVEMEAAAFFAAARFRRVPFGQILYGGDDVSGEDWDSRDWNSHTTVRDKLFSLAAEACLAMQP
jgi:uridine phosphorylase